MGEMINLTSDDGFKFGAYKATPKGKSRGGLVVVQEIFGVNSHIKKLTDSFAADGFVALAPALFDRVERGVEMGYQQSDIERGRAIRGKLGWDTMVMDMKAGVDALKKEGLKVAVVGYCMGGSLAWLASTRVPGVAAAVGYYGGAAAEFANEQPKSPVLLHFGETDQSIPKEHWDKIRTAQPKVPMHIYQGAGHGFSCDERASYHASSARLARERTMDFLKQHVG